MDVRRKIVGKDNTGNYEISTVFVGEQGSGSGFFFETMIFDIRTGDEAVGLHLFPTVYSGTRYRTFTEALAGHKSMVEDLQKYVASLLASLVIECFLD
jgi:hypothetical protein